MFHASLLKCNHPDHALVRVSVQRESGLVSVGMLEMTEVEAQHLVARLDEQASGDSKLAESSVS